MIISRSPSTAGDFHIPRQASTDVITRAAANFHFRLHFLQSVDELLEFMETWDFAISFVHFPARKYMYIFEYIHVERGACSRP